MDKSGSVTYHRYCLFRSMWLIFILFHMAISSPNWSTVGDGFLNPGNHFFLALNLLVIIFSLLALFGSRKQLFFILALIALTLVKLDALPLVPNHIILVVIIHLTLLAGILVYRDHSLLPQERIARWFQKIAPYIRIELLLLYFFVVLHKLNFDYFNPAVSCSAELYHDIAQTYPLFPEAIWLDWSMIIMTIGFELAIPILLMIPKTRVIGVSAGLIFHFLLSLHPNLYILSFSAELYALYILFLPESVIHRILTFVNQYSKTARQYLFRGALLTIVGAVIFLGIRQLVIGTTSLREDLLILFHLVHPLWIVWCLFLMAVSYYLFKGHFWKDDPSDYSLLKPSLSWLWIFLVLTFINGITPYVGLKTATNFSMFSNLRVEGADTNHLFMPTHLQVSSIQAHTVTILETNAPYFQNFIERSERITYFELTRFLYNHRRDTIYVTFRDKQNIRTIKVPNEDYKTWFHSSYLERKLLHFRGVQSNGSTPCQW